jgi:hypothetical protein
MPPAGGDHESKPSYGRHSAAPGTARTQVPLPGHAGFSAPGQRARIIRLGVLALVVAAAFGIALALVIRSSVGPSEPSSGTGVLLPAQRADDVIAPPATAPAGASPAGTPSATATPSKRVSPKPSLAGPVAGPLPTVGPSPFKPAQTGAVTAGGVGDFRIGQPAARLLSAAVATPNTGGQCSGGSAIAATNPEFVDPLSGRRLTAHVQGGTIRYVTIWTRAHRTAAGLGVGSGLAELMRSSASAEQYGDSSAGSVLIKDHSGAFLFALRGGTVKALVAGPAGELRRIAEQASRDPGNMSLLC